MRQEKSLFYSNKKFKFSKVRRIPCRVHLIISHLAWQFNYYRIMRLVLYFNKSSLAKTNETHQQMKCINRWDLKMLVLFHLFRKDRRGTFRRWCEYFSLLFSFDGTLTCWTCHCLFGKLVSGYWAARVKILRSFNLNKD